MNAPTVEQALSLAKKALTLMVQHGVAPVPNNYAIWYQYVAGTDAALTRELDHLLKQSLKFTPEVNDYLYQKFISPLAEAGHTEEKTENVTAEAKHLLSDVLRVMTQFSGDAESYNQELDQQVARMTDQSVNPEVHAIVQDIISSAVSLRESGAGLRRKLDESRREIESLRQNLAVATTESQQDFLTGVANRKALDKKLDEMIALAAEEKTDLCLLLIDIDHFKQFNDNFGHLIGDEVLKIVAKSLIDTVRGKDFVARYGGEEFAVILPATPVGGGMIVAEHVRQTIASRELKRRDTGENYGVVTVSIGVSYYHQGNDTLHSFIQRADEALYRSKKSGRNRVTQETITETT